MTQDEFKILKEKSSARILDKKKLDSLFFEELHIDKPRGFQLKSSSDFIPEIYNKLSDDELWNKILKSEPITREDLGLNHNDDSFVTLSYW